MFYVNCKMFKGEKSITISHFVQTMKFISKTALDSLGLHTTELYSSIGLKHAKCGKKVDEDHDIGNNR